MLKKILIGLGGLLVLFVIAAMVLPSVIDVDKFRPKIVQIVNDKINGELKLGKLKLSLWTGVDVAVDSVSLKVNGQPRPVIETDKAYFEIPFISLLTFSPKVTVVLISPKVDVVKLKDAKLNVMSLMKETPAQAAAKTSNSGSSGLPAIVANASAGLRIEKGYLSYADETSGAKYVVDGFDVDIQNLGLQRTVTAALKLPLKLNPGKMQIDGTLTANADFIPDMNNIDLRKLDVHFGKLGLEASGMVVLQPAMTAKMEIQTTEFDLSDLGKIVPTLREYALAGNLHLHVKTDGPVDALTYAGELEINGGKAAYPALLKAPIGFAMKSSFNQNALNLETFAVNGPSTDVMLKGSVENFKAPHFKFKLSGREIDVDQLLKSEPAKTAQTFPVSILPRAEAAPIVGDAGNPMLSLAKNPVLENAAGEFNIALGKVVAKGGTMTNVDAKIVLKDLLLTVESASLKTCDGEVTAKADANLKSPGLDFATSGALKGLSAKAALASYVPKFKNSFEGTIGANWNLKGRAFPKSDMVKSMGGTVNLTAENGKLSTIDFKESIKGIMSKLPFLKSTNPPNISQNFRSLRADMKFANGVITANPFEMVGDQHGINIKGKSTIQYAEMTQDTYVDVYDPNRLLPKEISNGKDAVMQLHVTGLVTSPQTDYGYTAGRLAKNVVKNEGANLIKKAIGNAAGDKGKEAVKGLLKGLGF